MRFQLSLFLWDQSPEGELLLKPTDDIVFFPALVTLAAGEERKVRVGAVTPAASSERTYRIFVEELPPLKKPEEPQQGGQVQLLTKMGIPIFLQPDKPVVGGSVGQMAVRKGVLSFQVANTGNVHFVAEQIKVGAYGTAGELLFEQPLEGWYVLAGGSRAYELKLPKKDCAKIKALEVDVETGQKSLKQRIEMGLGGCSE